MTDFDEKHAFDNGSGMTEVMTVPEMIAEIQRLGRLCVRYRERQTIPFCVNDTCLYSCADDECKKAVEKGIPWP